MSTAGGRRAPKLAAGQRRAVAGYALAVVAVLFVTVLKARVAWIGRDAPVAIYLGAVVSVAWFGGRGPGLLATGLSLVFQAWLFAAPYDSLAVGSADEAARLLIAGVEGTLISLLAGTLRTRNEVLQAHIRERERAEEALRRANAQMVHAQKMRAVGEFASGVSHDFNNMMTVALVCVDLVERKIPAAHESRAEVAELRSAIERAATLARQLLTFGRRRVEASGTIDVHELVTRIEPIVARIVGPSVRVAKELRAQRARVRGDAAQLEQAIVNLATNARDAMPAGGTLEISTSDASEETWRSQGRSRRPYLELVVRDSGAGMDEATRARVFEPFFTTHAAEDKGAGSGTGLGLSMVFGTVDTMGGVVSVESAPGKGATFRILLPVVASEPPAVAALSAASVTVR